MNISDFDYHLPKELIAQEPLPQRDKSRLMIVSAQIKHTTFDTIIDYLDKDDVLVLNNTKVIPAKLTGTTPAGKTAELLLTKQHNQTTWECLSRKKQENLTFGSIKGTLNNNTITFTEDIKPHLPQLGSTPLPPYIKKTAQLNRYNTVFAQHDGSIAAPTAGLHFTLELIKKIHKKGIHLAYITLHVGPGTFLPVHDINNHTMHPEEYTISQKTADAINNRKGKLYAVGTTTIRALESATHDGKISPCKGTTTLFIKPEYTWKLDYAGLITNFHLPKSTLLMLVTAFAGHNKTQQAYQEAIKNKYRFYSFGDAMLILK